MECTNFVVRWLAIGLVVVGALYLFDAGLTMMASDGLDFWLGTALVLTLTGGIVMWFRKTIVPLFLILLILSACTRVQPGNVGTAGLLLNISPINK